MKTNAEWVAELHAHNSFTMPTMDALKFIQYLQEHERGLMVRAHLNIEPNKIKFTKINP